MMSDVDVRPLLEQFIRHNGRGNMIAANETMVTIIETLAAAINIRASEPNATREVTIAPKMQATLVTDPVHPQEFRPPSEPLVDLPLAAAVDPSPVITPPAPTPAVLVDTPMAAPIPVKRKVGRPRKYPLTTEPRTE